LSHISQLRRSSRIKTLNYKPTMTTDSAAAFVGIMLSAAAFQAERSIPRSSCLQLPGDPSSGWRIPCFGM